MRERPIIFSGPMVRAILDGTKTQTRRVVKPQPESECGGWRWKPRKGWDVNVDHINASMCPYGVPGDRLWVREAWSAYSWDANAGWINIRYPTDGKYSNPIQLRGLKQVEWLDNFAANTHHCDCDDDHFYRIRPSIFMPRWASRITLEITGVSVERVQDISATDALAEGIAEDLRIGVMSEPTQPDDYIAAFSALWDSINAKRGFGWDSNPYVWVVEFKRVGADQ